MRNLRMCLLNIYINFLLLYTYTVKNIHFNPVKHGMVARVVDWPHSSFHRYVRHGLLPEDWAGDLREGEGRFGEP